MLDLMTLELFPEFTASARVAYFWYAPLTSALGHWMIGTTFMWAFITLRLPLQLNVSLGISLPNS